MPREKHRPRNNLKDLKSTPQFGPWHRNSLQQSKNKSNNNKNPPNPGEGIESDKVVIHY